MNGDALPVHTLTQLGHINLTGHYSWEEADYETPNRVIPIGRSKAKAA
jgi:hypothetical protein